MGATRVVLLAVVAFSLCAVPPAAAESRRCPTNDVEVLAKGSTSIVVLTKGRIVWGCLRRTNRGRIIGSEGFDTQLRANVSGHFVSLASTECDSGGDEAIGCFSTELVVWDLRRSKRTIRRTFAVDEADDVYAEVDALVLRSNGVVTAVLHVGANREIWLFCRGRAIRRMASSDVAPRLERSGRLVWAYSIRSGQRTVGFRARCRS